MRPEEEHPDVLQNLEFEVVSLYRAEPDLTDYEAMRVYEVLVDHYVAEKLGRERRKHPTTEVEKELFGRLLDMCQWRLGRTPGEDLAIDVEPISTDFLLRGLKRLIKSVKHWNKRGGTRGYLNYIARFVR